MNEAQNRGGVFGELIARDLYVHCGIDAYRDGGMYLILVLVVYRAEGIVEDLHVLCRIERDAIFMVAIFKSVALDDNVLVGKISVTDDLGKALDRQGGYRIIEIMTVERADV